MPTSAAGPKLNRIPPPPGLGKPNQDPVYQILRKYFDGPSLKLYYDWAQEIRTEGPDQYEEGDGLKRQKWLDAVRSGIYERQRTRNEDDDGY